ncbi:mevalonate kinase [Tubulinosema ratisbonensis]|uniref:Mevalonate kinase n=1 Tax=Tubulinosema ratisbonensis TaxID=291195 RepID=A0A437AL60_9MICR|nr:mevalonate kinase [Tubulinosema ratisbonensis]
MTSLARKSFKVPGKVVINGGYLVCLGEEAVSLTVDSYLNISYSYEQTDTFDFTYETDGKKEKLTFKNGIYASTTKNESFVIKIVKEFFCLTKFMPKGTFKVNFNFDEAFFTKEGVKLGLGSSSCLVVGISKILFDSFDIKEYIFIDLCKEINNHFSPLASGIDIFSVYKGNIFYKNGISTKLRTFKMTMLLGSMLKSNDTKECFHFLENKRVWNDLIPINKNINKLIKLGCLGNVELKNLFKEYLIELAKISEKIVPFYQYKVLLNTFEMDVIGCGMSGSGGEDGVWCLVKEDSLKRVSDYWKDKFKFVVQVNVLEKSGLIEL